MNTVLASWNQVEEGTAIAEILPCNGSRLWAMAITRKRPFATAAELFRAADVSWAELGVSEWQQAFDSHPRLGERHAAAARTKSLDWSLGEQKTLGENEATLAALAEGNRVYEQRFGRVFLVCATGKSAAEILAHLQHRLGNTPEIELREAVEQQRRITQLRLRKWLGIPAEHCEDV